MGRVRRLFERTESIGFKTVHKTVKKRFKEIEKISDPNDRLEPFKELKDMLDKVFDEHDYDVQEAVGKADKDRDGWTYYLQPLGIAGLFYAFISTISGTSVPALASAVPLVLSGVGAGVAGGLMIIGHIALRRHRARELGLTTSDVKHALKLKLHHAKVERHIKKIGVQETTKLHLDAISARYNGSSGRKRVKKKDRAPAAPAPAA